MPWVTRLEEPVKRPASLRIGLLRYEIFMMYQERRLIAWGDRVEEKMRPIWRTLRDIRRSYLEV